MPRVAESVRSTHSPDGAVVLDIRQGQIFTVNFVGSRILELLKQGNRQSEIADALATEFEVSRDVAQADVGEFIEKLRQYGLIQTNSNRNF